MVTPGESSGLLLASTRASASRCVHSRAKSRLAGQCVGTPHPAWLGLRAPAGCASLIARFFPLAAAPAPPPPAVPHADTPGFNSGWTLPRLGHLSLGGPEEGGAAADPARPGQSSGPIWVGTRRPRVGSAVCRGLEKSGLFSLYAARNPSLTLEKALLWANGIRDLGSTAFPLR